MTLFLISETGRPVAETIIREYPGATLVTGKPFAKYLSEHFTRDDAFIFIGAMGICVRLIAPYVRDKHTDPAVVCIDSTGRYVIPVLSGHIGRANELAADIARTLGAEAVITTQSDRLGLWALDTLGDKYGWAAEASVPMNRVISLFVGKAPTLLLIAARTKETEELVRTAPGHVTVCHEEPADLTPYRLLIRVTPFIASDAGIPTLTFTPRVFHAGIGLARQAAPVDGIIASMKRDLMDAGINPMAVGSVATIDVKKDEPVIKALQQKLPVSFYTAEQLKDIPVPTPSDVVSRHVGTPSVSEAAAILSSDNGELIMPKRKGTNYTIAIAAPHGVLRPHGHIEIVGAGPGDPELISLRGRHFLERADLILYAGSLVPRELTLCAKPGATVRSSAPMTLDEQFALMKQFYDQGKLIVRLHTGDPCIYGAIDEQMNRFDRHGMSYHITPGVSSFQAAAAELRSQFTVPERVQTIILTRGEGRTPMPEREKLRLLARSRSTMCIFLSASIADKVQEELLKEYPADTPVAVCYHLTWNDQRIYRCTLSQLADTVAAHHLTLTTLIVVGEAIGNRQGTSHLYAEDFSHLFRNS